MTSASTAQKAAIHATAKRIGLSEGERRDLIAATAGGKRSTTELTAGEAALVINRLKSIQGGGSRPAFQPAAAGAMRLEGEYAGICRALWLAGYNLGVVRNRTDRALIEFARSQTGIAHLDWVHGGADAAKIIEALKSWISREAGGVEWDADKAALQARRISLARWRKMAVIHAQLRRLAERGDHDAPTRAEIWSTDDAGLDRMSSELGARLRGATKRRGS